MSSKHQSRLLVAALAAIAFALVAVVAAPRPAIAAEDQYATAGKQLATNLGQQDSAYSYDETSDTRTITIASGTETKGAVTVDIPDLTIELGTSTLKTKGIITVSASGVTINAGERGTLENAANEPTKNATYILKVTGTDFTASGVTFTGGNFLAINVPTGAEATFKNCTVNCGSIGAYAAIQVSGKLTLTGGSVKATSGKALLINGGDVTTEGVELSGGSAPVTEGSDSEKNGGMGVVQIGTLPVEKPETPATSGTFEMTGGSIKNSNNGPAVVEVQGTFDLISGEITGGSDGSAPLISVGDAGANLSATFTMTNGTITASTAEAICIERGTANLNGGTVKGGGGDDVMAVQVGGDKTPAGGAVLTVNGATVCSAAEEQPTGAGGGIYVADNGQLTVKQGSTIQGAMAISTNGDNEGAASITIEGGKIEGSATGCGLYLPSASGTVNQVKISGGTISGGAGIVNLGSDLQIEGGEISSTGKGNVTVGNNKMEIPPAGVVNAVASEDTGYGSDTTTSVTGGTVNNGIVNGVTGDNSNIQGDPQLTVGGSATVNATDGKEPTNEPAITNNSGSTTVEDGTINGSVVNGADDQNYGENPPTVEVNGGSITASQGQDAITNNAGTTTMNSGTVNGNVQNNAGTTNLNNGTVNGNVANKDTSGSLNVGAPGSASGPTINGEATGAGTTVNSGTVTEGVGGGAVSAPSTPTPGAGTTVDNYVQGAVGPVQNATSGYANVTVSNDLKTWTVDVTEAGDETPLATVANNVVAQVISAIQRGGSGKVTSGSLSLDLPASQADIQAFALKVLQAAIGIPTQAADGPVASDLIGRTVTVTATTNTGSITYTFAFTGEGAPVTVYRLLNKLNGAHLFTSDENEYNVLTAEHPGEWIGEGARFTEPAQGTEPVYRLYNPNNGDHFFTKSKAEADTLSTIGWRIESANWYSGGDVQVMRFYNPSQVANEGLGNHLWTAEAPEIAALPSMGWQAEGLGWNALSVLQ